MQTYASFRANALFLTPGGDISSNDKDIDHNSIFILRLFCPLFEATMYTLNISPSKNLWEKQA